MLNSKNVKGKNIKGKNKEGLSEEELIQKQREKTAQQWIPISDIDGDIVYRKDNIILSMIRIYPVNIDLLSDREKRRKVEALSEALNGEKESMQLWCVGRPVDLNNYLEELQEKARLEQDFTKKMVLKGFIQDASKKASSGEATERRFYLIISKKIIDSKSQDELLYRLNSLKLNLEQAELNCEICHDDEILDVFSLFTSPAQATFELNEIEYDLPPLLNY